jgi:hypothetical protein
MGMITTDRCEIYSINYDRRVVGFKRCSDCGMFFLQAFGDILSAAAERIGQLVDVELVTFPSVSIEDLSKEVEPGHEFVSGEVLDFCLVPSLTPDETIKVYDDWYMSISKEDRETLSDIVNKGRHEE